MTDTQNTTAPASLVPEIRPEVWADLEQRYRKLEDTVRRYNPSANFQQIRAAFEFAAKAHGAQMRKDGSPFITHPLAVAQIVAEELHLDSESIEAALLHDVIEDTDVTFKTLSDKFGPRVAGLVQDMSENKRPELPPEETWLIRKEETISALERSADPALKQLFLADKLSNLRGIARDYTEYGDDLWEFFHQKSRAKQSWYYFRLESALSSLSDTDAFHEFHHLRLRVFEHGEA